MLWDEMVAFVPSHGSIESVARTAKSFLGISGDYSNEKITALGRQIEQ